MAKRVAEDEVPAQPEAKVAHAGPTAEHLLNHLRLKRIVKENHGAAIRAVVFNRVKSENFNLVATIADDQASIYDNANIGEHLDIISNFVNGPLPEGLRRENRSHDLLSLAWLQPTSDPDDAYLAIGSADTFIHVLSVARCAVVRLLQGHSDSVTLLASSAAAPDFLLSASKDRSIRVWHVPSGDCVGYVDFWPTALCWLADGRGFISASGHGVLKQWGISSVLDNLETARKQAVVLEANTVLTKQHTGEIDCIRLLGKTSVVSKSLGDIAVWDVATGKLERRFRIKGELGSSNQFDISTDGRFLVVGNSQGALIVWNVQTGEEITKLKYRRKESNAPVVGCGIAHDLKSIVYATNGPYLWRWDYVDPEAIKNYQGKREQE